VHLNIDISKIEIKLKQKFDIYVEINAYVPKKSNS
jgi:hypothetical protein